MKYPSYNRHAEQQLTFSDFSGGINAAAVDTALAANQFRDAENVWWKDGILRTRPGLALSRIFFHDLVTVHQRVMAPEVIFYQGKPGRLEFVLHTSDDTSGYSLAVYFYQLDGEVVTVRRLVSDAQWTTKPTQILPINDGKELGLVYVDAIPYRLSKNGTMTEVHPYIPTVVIAARGCADKATARTLTAPPGTLYEPFNRLTDALKVEYILTEDRPYFTLPSAARYRPGRLSVTLKGSFDSTYVAESEFNMATITTPIYNGVHLVWSTPQGIFWFIDKDENVVTPDANNWSSISVTFLPAVDNPDSRAIIKSMRFAAWFGGSLSGLGGGTRCFLAGSEKTPSRLCYSGVQDATYFPENNDAYVGQPGQAITALKKQSDMLVIFKEHEIWYSTYQTGTTDQSALTNALENGAVVDIEAALATFPLANISSDIGCDSPDTIALCDNRLVWTNSDARTYVLVSGNIYSERNVRYIGESIYPLLKTRDLSQMYASDYADHYCLHVGSEIFLFDYNAAALAAVSAGTSNDSLNKRIAWYRWRFPVDSPPLFAVAMGDEMAVAIYTESSNALCLYRLADEEDFPEGPPQPIHTMLRWPTFTAGSSGRRQSIRRIVLDTGSPYTTVHLLPIGDRETCDEHLRHIRTDASGIARLLGGIRHVRDFSLQAEIEGKTVWRSLSMSILIH
ncbi:MAG: hypothetical protein IJC17_05495 [Clostridia bacterium]|nr:hypothetical protein [Clostridia bacterium]